MANRLLDKAPRTREHEIWERYDETGQVTGLMIYRSMMPHTTPVVMTIREHNGGLLLYAEITNNRDLQMSVGRTPTEANLAEIEREFEVSLARG